MSNGNQPGVSQSYGGTGFAANQAEIYQMGDLSGQLGFTPIGSDGLVDLGPDYAEPDVTRTFITPEHLAGDRRTSQTTIPGRATNLVTVEQAQNVYYSLQEDPEKRAEWQDLTKNYLGYIPNPQYQQALWNQATQYVAGYQKATGKTMTPQQYMKIVGDQQAATRRGQYTGPVTTTEVRKDVNLTNPSQARAFLDNALGEYLGRLPSADEYENFRAALNAEERMAPVITKSTSTVTPQGDAKRDVKAESTRKGGVTPGQFATEFARSQEGAGEVAAAGPLLNAFINLIRGGN